MTTPNHAGTVTHRSHELARKIVALVLRDQEAAWSAVTQLIHADLTALQTQLEEARKDKWQTGTPSVPVGSRKKFWVTWRHKGSGKLSTRCLEYCNRHQMPLSDNCDEVPEGVEEIGDEYAWTGWAELSCDNCDTQWMFAGEVIAWMELPAALATNLQEEKK